MTLPRPYQADADGDQAAESAHDRLPLHEPDDDLQHRQRRGDTDRKIEVAGDDEQHDEQHARQHRFDDAARPADGVDDGEVLPLARGGEGRHTRTFLLVLIGHARSLAPGVERGIRQRTSENIGPRDSVVLTSVC